MMHPAILQQVAAEHVKDMIATADKARRAQDARRARRWRTAASGAAPPASHRVQTRMTVSTKPDSDRPDSLTHISAVDTEQPQEPALAAPPARTDRLSPVLRQTLGPTGPSAYHRRMSNPMSHAPVASDHPAMTCRPGPAGSRE